MLTVIFYGEKIFQIDTKEESLRLLSLRPVGNRKNNLKFKDIFRILKCIKGLEDYKSTRH